MPSSRSGRGGAPARRSYAANRRRHPATSASRHLVICRMQIWRPTSTDSAPVHTAPHEALDPLIHLVLGGNRPFVPLPIHPWWEETVERAMFTSRWDDRLLSPPLGTRLDESTSTTVGAAAPPHLVSLSAREQEILLLVAEGLPNKAIADRLIIAASTVKWYLKHVYLKLDVHNRAQAIARLHASP
jgi:DNA-binding CsgD family transcriptional regulator